MKKDSIINKYNHRLLILTQKFTFSCMNLSLFHEEVNLVVQFFKFFNHILIPVLFINLFLYHSRHLQNHRHYLPANIYEALFYVIFKLCIGVSEFADLAMERLGDILFYEAKLVSNRHQLLLKSKNLRL